MTHDKLILPHPVLRPGGGLDYNDECDFGLEIGAGGSRRTAEGLVRVEGSLTLASRTLEEMVKEGKARYLVLATCTKTYYRRAVFPDTEKVSLEIPTGELAGTLRLTPYVVASEELDWFVAPEHDPEIKKFRGNGRIPAGSILAVGAPHEVEMEHIGSIMSAIKLVPNEGVEEGRYAINDRGDFVLIEFGPKTYADVVRMRGNIRDLLYSSVYQAAVEYSLRKIVDEPDSRWAKALQKTLAEHDITSDDVGENANHYAQVIMGNPLGRMIDWCDRSVSFD